MNATYRLQLTPDFDLFDAAAIVPTLQALGISHLYLSPIFEARPGSTHGYDVTDPSRIRSALGGDAGHCALTDAVRAADMKLLLDIVPNHMAADAANPWWWDVLKHGRNSPLAPVFDIDWQENAGRIVLPVLGAPLDDILRSGELRVDRGSLYDPAEPVLRYFDHRFPLATPAAQSSSEGRALADLLAAQHYELVFWRDGLQRLTYRRFFDIAELVAVRINDPPVFDRTHRRLLELSADESVAGVRVDHIDGLHDPAAYLRRLRHEFDACRAGRERCVIYVEKILTGDEQLPPGWPVDGSTGYEFAANLTPLFIDSKGFRTIEADAVQRGVCTDAFADALFDAKVQVQRDLFSAELTRLTRHFIDAASVRGESAIPTGDAQHAIMTLTAALPVYRTYIDAHGMSPVDRQRLEVAFDDARAKIPATDSDRSRALYTLQNVFLNDNHDDDAVRAFITAWQQFSGAVMAKGGEDTALYRHIALSSLNDVGDDPVLPADPVAAFHHANLQRAQHLPSTINTTATHDSKRGEDTRARISVLSEISETWTAALDRWMNWHEPLRRRIEGTAAPSPADEVLFYQSLLAIIPPGSPADGIDPALKTRLQDYAVKASREAKVHTNWYAPNDQYEKALREFIDRVLNGEDGKRFRADITALLSLVSFHGAINSLAQVVLKAASPGVPDFYQGAGHWNLTLVDPDNRQPIDRAALRSAMQSLPAPDAPRMSPQQLRNLRDNWHDGQIKLYITMCALTARQFMNNLNNGDYQPLFAEGRQSEHVIAFTRRIENRWLLAIAPRLTVSLANRTCHWPVGTDVWGDTTLSLPAAAPQQWTNWFADTSVHCANHTFRLAELLDPIPVGLFTAE